MTHHLPLNWCAGAGARTRVWGWLIAACALFLFVAPRAFAQEATIVGTVTDPSGAVVPNVTITATSVETGLATTIATAPDGQYVIPGLHIGHYTVKAAGTGFKVLEKTGVVLNVGDRLRLDFQLQVGGSAQTVTVAADTIHIQTDTGEVSDVISSQQLSKLASNGRSIYTLVSLTPGASSLQADSQAPVPVGGDANVSVNGQRMSHNIYLMDGGEDLDRGGAGTFSVMPSLQAIAEFTILTSNYSPEYGLSSAATVTTAIKSGTKSFHGQAWEFDRNDYLDARNITNRVGRTAELRNNIFGANIGGPVSFHPNRSEPKTFFFYNQEWRRIISGQTLNQKVPIPATYGGNFASAVPADLSDPNDSTGNTKVAHSGFHVPCQSQLSAAQQNAFAAAFDTSVDEVPWSTPGGDGSCQMSKGVTLPVYSAWPSNAFPGTGSATLLDANAQALLNNGKIFPAPNSGAFFTGGANQPTYVTEEIARVDQKIGDKFSIFGHWVSEQITQTFGTTMWSGDNVPTIGNTFGNPSYSAVVHTTYTINPNILNEAAFNFNGNRIHILPQAGFGAPLAYPSSFTPHRVFTGPDPDNVMPTINLSGATGAQYSANWTPWNNDANDYQLRDDISWVKGAHQLKFGASWSLYSKIQDAFAAPQGNFGFNGFYTGNDFADFLLGYSNSYSEDAVHDSGHWNNISWAAYFGDNWHATPRLTLNLGLRWDGVPHTYEVNERASDFYPSLYSSSEQATFDTAGNVCGSASDPGCTAASPGLGGSPNAILKAAGVQFYLNGVGIGGVTAGVPRGLANNHWNAWGPRLGLSYDLTGHGKTVVRAGFGIMYERIQGNDMYDDATNVPFDATANFSNVDLATGHGVLSDIPIAGSTLPVVVASMTGLDSSNYKLPSDYQYSAGVQQSLSGNTLLSVSYVGSQSRHQNDFRETNLPPVADLAGLVNSGGTGYNQDVPYLGFRSIKQAECVANGKYNSMQLDLHSVIHRDLQAQFGFTWSRSDDPTTGNGGNGYDLDSVSNPYAGWRYDYGPSVFDRTAIAFVNYIYDIPAFRNSSNAAARTILGGWEISGVSYFESGPPLNITVSGATSSNGVQNGQNRPNLTGTVSYPKQFITDPNDPNKETGNLHWFNGSAFQTPDAGTWGNVTHDSLRGPGRDNWNLSLHKIFKFSESANFDLRAAAFNVWNHTQWKADVNNGGIGNSLNGSNFGYITSAWDPRVFQLGGIISF